MSSPCTRQHSQAIVPTCISVFLQAASWHNTTHLDIPRILVQNTPLLANLVESRRLPLLLPLGLLLVVDEPVDLARPGIDDDLVPVLDERDWATVDSFGDDVACVQDSDGGVRHMFLLTRM